MGTALTQAHAKKLAQYAKEVVLVFDGDKAGLAATAKNIPILGGSGLQVSVATLPTGIDPDDYVKAHGKDAFVQLINKSVGALTFMYEYAKTGLNIATPDGINQYEQRLEEIGKQFGVGSQLLWKFRKEEKGKNRQQGHQSVSMGMPVGAGSVQIVPKEVKAERQLIYYMCLDKAAFDAVDAQMGMAFNIDQYRKIARAVEAYYKSDEKLEIESFLKQLDSHSAEVVAEIFKTYETLPQSWTPKLLKDLIGHVKKGAIKLAMTGKKQQFNQATYPEQLKLIGELSQVKWSD
jgi:DNA primase